MDLGLEDRVAVVLASSKGLGRAAAEALAREGCNVAICARNQDTLEQTAQDIRDKYGRKVLALNCDVSDAASLRAFFKAVDREYGRVDVLINNAGGPDAGNAGAFSDEAWHGAYEQVLMSVVRACRHVVPGMKERRWGRIINVTSVSAKEPLEGMILSNTFRPAIAGFAKSLAAELGAYGVTVHCFMPGSMMTDRNLQLGANIAETRGMTLEELVEEWKARQPMRRMGEPSEFGDHVAYFASERCSFSTGTCVAIEGGTIKAI